MFLMILIKNNVKKYNLMLFGQKNGGLQVLDNINKVLM